MISGTSQRLLQGIRFFRCEKRLNGYFSEFEFSDKRLDHGDTIIGFFFYTRYFGILVIYSILCGGVDTDCSDKHHKVWDKSLG